MLQGAKLSEIQTRLASEFGLKLTYMEVRFLVDDLKLTPKDPEPPKVAAPVAEAAKPADTKSRSAAATEPPPARPAAVSVTRGPIDAARRDCQRQGRRSATASRPTGIWIKRAGWAS